MSALTVWRPVLPPPPEIVPPLHHHVRRVTCNLVRISSEGVCPPDLRELLQRIADAGWDFSALTPEEDEILFGELDWNLAHRAQAEFEVDSSRRRYYRHSSVECQLCGHPHNKVEFYARNTVSGHELWIGSTCVVTWVTRVDGGLVGAQALERLKVALSEVHREMAREAWQEQHPTWEEDLALLSRVTPGWRSMIPRVLGVDDRCREVAEVAKYFSRERFLTPQKTTQAYGSDGLVAWVRDVEDRSSRVRDLGDRSREYYMQLRDSVTAEQTGGLGREVQRGLSRLDYWISRGSPRIDRLDAYDRALVLDLELLSGLSALTDIIITKRKNR